MAKTFKVLSLLLTYPEAELQEAAGEMKQILASEKLVPANCLEGLTRLLDEIAEGDLYDLQERYVLLFDRSRSLSLHLFEHIHGESRDRGQAMVDLAEHYERHGLVLSARELPDFLPLFLEFLATRPLPEALELLEQPLDVVAALAERLRKRKSDYAWVLLALEGISRGKPSQAVLDELLAAPDDDPEDLEALDRAWEDQPVTFGPGAPGAGGVSPGGGCPAVRDTLARMDRPADTKPL
ncbi:nitrate reductase molybdenum cofactor assembly chaperone [Pelagibius marinus]|uniref:nitrate reductase molybdenum cofactor assembly chaperone n=1 Tax=Pelagibius marinus TaxID=2762760 RepID=UPI0018726C7F|nr:nitrate reductase molybdenum cofactor assembly chaperone [Pelagibius marinus]